MEKLDFDRLNKYYINYLNIDKFNNLIFMNIKINLDLINNFFPKENVFTLKFYFNSLNDIEENYFKISIFNINNFNYDIIKEKNNYFLEVNINIEELKLLKDKSFYINVSPNNKENVLNIENFKLYSIYTNIGNICSAKNYNLKDRFLLLINYFTELKDRLNLK